MTGYEKKFEQMVTSAAREAFDVAVTTGNRQLYLYYRPSGPLSWGELRVLADGQRVPDGFTLAINQRIPMSRTVDGIRAFLYPHCRRLAVLPTDPDYRK